MTQVLRGREKEIWRRAILVSQVSQDHTSEWECKLSSFIRLFVFLKIAESSAVASSDL